MSRSIKTPRRAILVVSALILSAGVLALPGRLARLTMPAAQAAGFTWTGAVSSDWFTAGNWSPAGVPGANDTATVNSGTVDITADVSVAALNFSNGTIRGAGTLTVTGALNWTGGSMRGPGTTLIAVGATAGAPATNSFRILEGGRVFNNAGTFNCSGLGPNGSCILAQTGGYTFNNSGTLDFQVDAGFLSGSVLNNTGTVRKSGGAGKSEITAGFDNNGTVEVLSGELQIGNFASNDTSGGAFDVAAGATLNFVTNTHNLTAGSSVGGAGNVVFSVGTVNVNGTYHVTGTTTIGVNGNAVANFNTDVTLQPLVLNGGVLGGTAKVTLAGKSSWTGGFMRGTGATVIAQSAALDISGPATKIIEGRALTNHGTTSISGTGQGCGFGGANFTINNAGTMNFGDGGHFTGCNGAAGTLNNTGTLRKSAGADATLIQHAVNNSGTVEVQTGTLSLGSTFTNGTSAGAFTVAPGATLQFNCDGGTHALTDTSSISGAGNVHFLAGTIDVNGAYHVTGTTTVSGSRIPAANFNAAAAIPTVLLNGGRFGGSGVVTVNSFTMEQHGSTGNSILTGTGTLVIPAGGTMVIDGDPLPGGGTLMFLEYTRTVTNEGTIIFRGGQSVQLLSGYLGTDTVFSGHARVTVNNRGLFDVQTDRAFGVNDGPKSSVFNNTGTFRKSAGGGVTNFGGDFAFTNRGTVEVQTGILNFRAGYTQDAGLTLLNGGTLGGRFDLAFAPNQSCVINGGTLAGVGSVEFASVINSGTISPGVTTGAAGTLTLTGNYTQTGAGSYNVDLFGAVPGVGFDQLIVGTLSTSSTSTVDGILNIFRRDGFIPTANDSFQITRTGGDQDGQFDAVNGKDIPTSTGAGTFTVNYSDFDVVLVAGVKGGAPGGSVSPRPWVDLIGPDEVRLGPPTEFNTSFRYTVKYGNSSLRSAGVVVPITVLLPPGSKNIKFEPDNSSNGVAHEPLTEVVMTPEERRAFDEMPRGFPTKKLTEDPTGGEVAVPVFAYAAPGARNEFTITFQAPCPPAPGGRDGVQGAKVVVGDPINFQNLGACAGSMLEFALGFVPGGDCALLLAEMFSKIGTTAATGKNAFSGASAIFSLLVGGAKCAASFFPVAKAIATALEILDAIAKGNNIASFVTDCGGFLINTGGSNKASAATKCVASRDPNAKYGSQGFGEVRYVSGETPMHYLVTFENVPDASAPAQVVTITDQLDTANFDLDTFYFETMTFGEHKITPPPASTHFIGEVDLRPANDLIVRVEARLDAGTGLATWRFSSIDPATGRPLDPSSVAGFLPPNANPPEGEGSVSFSVELKEGIASGTAIRNRARIVFDQNEPIDTGEWLNTIDNANPSSSVHPLGSTQSSESFTVQWSGADAHSGVANFSVFVSEDGGPFEPWLRNTAETSAVFAGQQGKSYGFYSLAGDNTGNVEAAKTAAEATTTVNTDGSGPVTTAALSRPANAAGWHNADVTLTLNAADEGSGVREITYTMTGAQSITGETVAGSSISIPVTAEGATQISFFAKDNVGNAEVPQAVTVRLDKTAPAVTCAPPDGLWHAADVSINCTADGGVSGLADPADVSFSLTTGVAPDTETADAPTGSRAVADLAGNAAVAGPIGGNKVDKKAPAIALTSPADGGSYLLNQAVTAGYACTDGGSGVSGCVGTVPNGSPLDTTAAGAKVFAVNAADAVGNAVALSVTYAFTYAATYGIRALHDETKAHRSGSVIPIKLQLLDANGVNVSSQNIALTALGTSRLSDEAPGEVADAGAANPDYNFRFTTFDAAGGYIYNLNTSGLATGTYVLTFRVAGDPVTYATRFSIR